MMTVDELLKRVVDGEPIPADVALDNFFRVAYECIRLRDEVNGLTGKLERAEAQLTLAETEMLNAKAWSAGTQAKRHIDFAMTAICCARALLQSGEVKK